MSRTISNQTPTPPRDATPKPSQLLHITVRNNILSDLTKADLKSGERYFTEGELAIQHNVSRNTIRRAMADLEKKGYIKRQQGQGSFIQDLPVSTESLLRSSSKTAVSSSLAGSGALNQKNELRQIQRLIVILASWDDTTDGFYSSRILQELISLSKAMDLTIEIRHPTDPINLDLDRETAVLAMDPRGITSVNLNELANRGACVIVTAPEFPSPLALNLCDAQRQTACEAVKQFVRLGHPHVGIIYHTTEHRDFQQALMGFLDAHSELNLPIHPQATACYTNKIEKPSIDPTQVTAWICTFNAAVNLLATRCQLHDLTIPDDISLVCFDSPNEQVTAAIGKRISVMQPDARLIAKNVLSAIAHWQEKFRGETIELPMQKIAGQTIAPYR